LILLIVVHGKDVYTDIEELADPSHTALLLIDMQYDFVDPGGLFGSMGVDLSMYEELRPRLAELLGAARESGALVIHLQNTQLAEHMSDSPAQHRFNLRMHGDFRQGDLPLTYTVPGTKGHEFLPEFQPRDGELVVRKYRSSGFWGTNLDMLLRSNQVETVVVAGCTTEGCVESTARDAMFNDYYVVIPEDCVASDDRAQHEASILLMRHRFDISIGSEVCKVWETVHNTSGG
jgi:nicotinamidase-related amidase